jgi:Zn-dependent alcohol dehydrogenase
VGLSAAQAARRVSDRRISTVDLNEGVPALAKKSLAMTFMGSCNFHYDLALIADLYLQGRYNLDDLVARTCSLENMEEGFEALGRGEIARTVITFD